jgi:hypothetical protein
MSRIVSAFVVVVLFAATLFGQIAETDSTTVYQTGPAEGSSQVQPAPVSSVKKESAGTMTSKRKALLEEGRTQRGTGQALTAVGAVFMGVFVVYTVLFVSDPKTYGISMGSTSSGYVTTEYYFNPGFIALPIGAPLLAIGIVNSLKGKHKIQRAENGDESRANCRIRPYLALNLREKSLCTGAVLAF